MFLPVKVNKLAYHRVKTPVFHFLGPGIAAGVLQSMVATLDQHFVVVKVLAPPHDQLFQPDSVLC